MVSPVRVNGRELRPHKAAVSPLLDSRNVLTKSPWEFVSLWLTRNKKPDALFYWNQAREFARAAVGMPVESAPLLHYYSFMNASKALLAAKGVSFAERHGVRSANLRASSTRIELANEGVRIEASGILPSLATYLGDTEPTTTHTLKELLFNLPFVHRTYCLTYQNQSDLFFSLTECQYVFDSATSKSYLSAQLSKEFTDRTHLSRLPPAFIPDPTGEGPGAVRSAASVMISSGRATLPADDLERLATLNHQLRPDLQHISGTQTLWYVKAIVRGPRRLQRSPLTLTLAAMHRLSEICRYRPSQLASFLGGQRNWLINEFVLMSPEQFLDGIASELTGHQFMIPNVRPAT
jgi:hypothetical protein